MAKKRAFDTPLFAMTAVLVAVGLVMVWSASSALAVESHGNPNYHMLRQAAWVAVGFAALFGALRLDYRILRQPAAVYGVLMLTTLLLIAVLFARPVNDTHRWLRFGGASLQPSELAKLAVILYLAYHLERRSDRVNEFLPTLFPALLLVGWFTFLIYIQPDLGTAATVIAVGGVMLFLSGVRLRYFVALALPIAGLLYYGITTAAYRSERMRAFLDPWSDPRGAGYHIIQSQTAIGIGGVTGVGIMEGRQKLFYLPYPFSDFIYAVIGEELGLLGATAVVAAFLVFLWRGVRTALRAPDRFALLLAAGLTLAIVVQALINVSVVLGLLPTKGIPLPFISAGGTSLVLSLFSVGLVLNISQHAD